MPALSRILNNRDTDFHSAEPHSGNNKRLFIETSRCGGFQLVKRLVEAAVGSACLPAHGRNVYQTHESLTHKHRNKTQKCKGFKLFSFPRGNKFVIVWIVKCGTLAGSSFLKRDVSSYYC